VKSSNWLVSLSKQRTFTPTCNETYTLNLWLPFILRHEYEGILALEKNHKVTGLKKYIYSTYSHWSPHTYDFVVLTSWTHPRNILLIVLQIGKQEVGKAIYLSASLRTKNTNSLGKAKFNLLIINNRSETDIYRLLFPITCCNYKILNYICLFNYIMSFIHLTL
jgi:hypothetical protein